MKVAKGCLFKYSELRKLLNHMKEHYTVTPLANWDGSNAIILRHDVDFDIKAAYNLALLEKEVGIYSTFFIMTTCHTYNPTSKVNRQMLVEISENGFEIGLHFDPLIYGKTSEEELQKKVDAEANILSSILNKEIKSVSLHNPSIGNKYPLFEGYNNAYDQRIFQPECYISDSRMVLVNNIYNFLEKSRRMPIQILLHPMHYSEDGKTYPDICYQFVHDFVKQIDNYFRLNSTYCTLLKTDLFTYILKRKQRPGDRI